LRITDIVPSQIDWESVPYCKIDEREKDKFSLASGDIVIARTGATVGYAKLIRDNPEAVFASYLVRVRVDPKYADPGYVGRIVESKVYKRFVMSRVGGAAQPNANAKVLSSFPLQVPGRSTQARFVEVLSAYDDMIENNRRRIQLLEEAARLLYKEWFAHLRFPGHEHVKITDGVPEGWERKVLGDVCFEIRETVDPKSLEPNTPYIGLEHMPRRSITLSDWDYAEKVTSSKHRFREGEILFGKIRPYFHKVGFALTDGIASSDAIVIRPASSHLLALVLMTTSSDGFIAVTAQQMKEGSKMPRADWKQMQQYPLPQPPEGILRAFSDFIEPILDQLKKLSFANRQLAAARDLLLPRLMNGEIAV
jgi:type I restriction enzyme S subunit